MAIFGIGSKWGNEEVKDLFFKDNKISIGWNDENASDVYYLLASMKIGDIVYLKSNRPGSRTVKVKGICIIMENFIEYLKNNDIDKIDFWNWESMSLKVKWLNKKEFDIKIPENTGKLTNIRAATLYEEYLPFVQKEIIEKMIGKSI